MRPMVKNRRRNTGMKAFFQNLLGAIRAPLQNELLTKAMEFEAGIESEARNPDKLLIDKNKDLLFYDKMMTDDRISSVIEIKKRLILSFGGDFIASSDDPKAIERRDFIAQMFYSMHETGAAEMPVRFWDVFDNLLDAMVYGFRVAEIIWRMDDGKMVVKNLKFMHPIFFDFGYDEKANLQKVLIGHNYGRDTVVEGQDIKTKLLIYVNPYLKDGNWYGKSDLQEVYTQYYCKYHLFRYRNVYLQNYGQPIPIVTIDKAKTTPAEVSELEEMLDNFQDNKWLIIPGVRDPKSGELHGKFEIDFRDGGTSKGTDGFEKAIEQLDKQIARKLLLPDKLGFSESDTGSYNLGEKQFDMLMAFIGDTHGRLEDAMNNLIRIVEEINFGEQEEYTEWKFNSADDRITSTVLKELIDAGVVDPEEKWVRSRIGIPELSEEEREEIEERKKERAPKMVPGVTPTANPFQPEQEQMKNAAELKKLSQMLDQAAADFERDYSEIHTEESEYLVGQIQRKKIVEDNDTKAMETLRVKKGPLKKALSLFYAKMYMLGKVSALDEAAGRIEKRDMKDAPVEFQDEDEWLDREWLDRFLKEYGPLGVLSKEDLKYLRTLRDRAFYITGVEEERVLKIAKDALYEGIRSGLPAKGVISKIEAVLREDRQKYKTTIARTNMSDAFNTGRMNTFTQDSVRPFIEAYQYQIIDDTDTTPFCLAHKNQIIRADDPQLALVTPPNHFNCRSILVAIFVGDNENRGGPFYRYMTRFEPWGTGVPAGLRLPAKGFGG